MKEGMKVQSVSMDTLVPDDHNARKGNVASIVESLREFGQHRAVVVQRGTNKIIAGNHLFFAAQTLGWERIDAYFVDDDDTKAIRRSIADNATNDKATWEDSVLRDLLDQVGEDIAGVDHDLLARLAKLDVQPEERPTYPIVPQAGEKYSYVVIIADGVVDIAWLETAFQFETYQSYKSTLTGSSRVMTVAKFRQVLKEMAKYEGVSSD